MKKKLFISHASEDKDDFVRPLAEALRTDFEVWYDEYSLVIGHNLLEEISKGLANCDFGVVVLSKHFFDKKWPQDELNGLFALEEKDKKIILPVWKDVSKEDVLRYSPILAGRMAAMAKDGVDKVVYEIKRAVQYSEIGKSLEKPKSGLHKLLASIEKEREEKRSADIVGSCQGVSIAWNTAKQTIDTLAEQIGSLSEHGSIIGLCIDGPKGNDVHYRIGIWIGKIILYAEYLNDVANSANWARIHFSVGRAEGDYPHGNSQFIWYEKQDYSLYIDINDNKFWKPKSKQLLSPEQLVDLWLEKLSSTVDK